MIEFARDPTQWFTVAGLITATSQGVFAPHIVLLVRMRSRIWRYIRGLFRFRKSAKEIRIAFYERFETLCAQLGLVRSAEQTQREFAGTVGPRIRQIAVSSNGLVELPPRLVEFFYRVRFGEEDLSPAVIDDLNRELTAFEQAVRKPNRR
jgi:hypothetical protein